MTTRARRCPLLRRTATSRASAKRTESTDSTCSAQRATARTLFRCSPPMRCHRGRASGRSAATASTLRVASCTRFSPSRSSPRSSSAATSPADTVLVTAISATSSGRRAAAAQASRSVAGRPRAARQLGASCGRHLLGPPARSSAPFPWTDSPPMIRDGAGRLVRGRAAASTVGGVAPDRRHSRAPVVVGSHRVDGVRGARGVRRARWRAKSRVRPASATPAARAGGQDGSSQMMAAWRPVRPSRRWL